MHRRAVLKSVLSAFAGAGLLSTRAAELPNETPTPTSKAKGQPTSFLTTSDGTALFYRDCGTGSPLVFLAPWGLHSDWWEYQMAFLSAHGLRCIAYDRRGHGRSVESAAGYEFNTLSDDLSAVMQQLDLQHVTLVAHSLGCGELVRYFSRHGGRGIARVVMVAPITPMTLKTPDNPDGVDTATLEKAREALCNDRPHVIAAAAPAFFGAPKNPVSAEMMQWWTNMLLQCSMKVLLQLHRVFTTSDFRPDLRAISLPTLIIQGDCDTSTPLELTGRRTTALIPGSQLTVYEGAAHGLPITHADRLNHDLLAYASS